MHSPANPKLQDPNEPRQFLAEREEINLERDPTLPPANRLALNMAEIESRVRQTIENLPVGHPRPPNPIPLSRDITIRDRVVLLRQDADSAMQYYPSHRSSSSRDINISESRVLVRQNSYYSSRPSSSDITNENLFKPTNDSTPKSKLDQLCPAVTYQEFLGSMKWENVDLARFHERSASGGFVQEEPRQYWLLFQLNLPVKKSGFNEDCSICLSSFKGLLDIDQERNIRMLPCRHIFHDGCITNWIITAEHNSCPICKRGVLDILQ